MDTLKAVILGIVQGLTEFLPVSSSGHLELFQALFKVNPELHLSFDVVVHFATTMSIFIVYRKDIGNLIVNGLLRRQKKELNYILMLVISAIPVGIIGILLKDTLEKIFFGNLLLVGIAFLFTAFLLYSTKLIKENKEELTMKKSFIVGLAQVIALIPGISRSGTTISSALLMKIDREEAARFSFLMSLIPILGATLLETKDVLETGGFSELPVTAFVLGFLAAFLAGIFGCTLVKKLVQTRSFYKFAYYCLFIGIFTIIVSFYVS